jgi:hypothetical protein
MDESMTHPIDELPSMLAGELPVARTREVLAHLRSCDDCRVALAELAAGSGFLARAHRVDEATMAPESLSLPPLVLPRDETQVPLTVVPAAESTGTARTARTGTKRLSYAVAAVVVALAVVGSALLIGSRGSNAQRHVALVEVGHTTASGRVSMNGGSQTTIMAIDASVPTAAPKTYYAVWLLDVHTGGMVAVGVLPPNGHTRFTLPTSVLSRYDAVDVSLQPDNGSTVHSADSVLRARYA